MDLSQTNNAAGPLISNMSDLTDEVFIDPKQLVLVSDSDVVGVAFSNKEQDTNAEWYSSKQRDLMLQLNEAALQTASSPSKCTAGCKAAALSDKIAAINSTVAEDDADSITPDNEPSNKDETDEVLRFAGVKRIKKPRPMKKDEQVETIRQLKEQLRALPPVQSQPEAQSQATQTSTGAAYQAILDRELSGSNQPDDSLFNISPMKPTKKRGRKPKNVDETVKTADDELPTSLPQKKQKKLVRGAPRAASNDKKTFNATVMEVLDTLRAMRDHKELTSVMDYASGVLSTQENCQEPLKRLAEIDTKYRAASKEVFDELVEFLDYYGAIPKGGLDR